MQHSSWDVPLDSRDNQQVFLIVDVTLKILLGEMVESRCEGELAHRASVVIDGYSGDIENPAPVNLAVLVEIDDAVEVSHSTTALARRFLRAYGLQSRIHQASPRDTAYIFSDPTGLQVLKKCRVS